jgi:hypothetical protein
MSGPLLTGFRHGISVAGPHVTHPSVLILGTDAVLAAAPATPVQLIHACMSAGFSAVVPASWGDELIAARAIDRVCSTDGPVVQCSCPLVSRRLATHGDALTPMVFASVAPAVATALYVRALYAPAVVEITFAGACPAGADPAIDGRVSCAELLETLRARGIDVQTAPTEFDSVLPPDRRRFYSEAGGTPARSALHRRAPAADFVELGHENFAVDLAQHLLANSRMLIDLAPALGCACSGAQPGLTLAERRARVREQEPPRAMGPVVEHELTLALDRSLPVADGAQLPMTARTAAPMEQLQPTTPDAPEREPESESDRSVAVEDVRRRSPVNSRAIIGAMPQAKSAGRALPRAYVARRRSSPKGMRQSTIRKADSVAQDRRPWKLIALVAGAVAGAALLLQVLL